MDCGGSASYSGSDVASGRTADGSAPARVLQNSRDLRIAPCAGVGQGGHAVAIGQKYIGAGLDQGLDRGGVVRAAIAEHDRLEQRGPAEIVDVIERGLGRDQG